jgi:hypothetical protein
MILAIGIELALDVPIQRPHDADPRKHRRPAQRRDQHQRFHGGLPLRGHVFGLRELGDVGASVHQGDEPLPIRQRDRVLKTLSPSLGREVYRISMVLNSERSPSWLLTTISGRSRAEVVRSNEWAPRDSVTSDGRIATRIVESGKARASTRLCAPFNHRS